MADSDGPPSQQFLTLEGCIIIFPILRLHWTSDSQKYAVQLFSSSSLVIINFTFISLFEKGAWTKLHQPQASCILHRT